MDYMENVYDDLENFDLGTQVTELQEKNKQLENHIQSLEKDVEKLSTTVVDLKKIQLNLTTNVSELFKTAKAEIERKDRTITELREKLENITFRRESRENYATNNRKRDRNNSSSEVNEEDRSKVKENSEDYKKRKYDDRSKYYKPDDRHRSYYNEKKHDNHVDKTKAGYRSFEREKYGQNKDSRPRISDHDFKKHARPANKNKIEPNITPHVKFIDDKLLVPTSSRIDEKIKLNPVINNIKETKPENTQKNDRQAMIDRLFNEEKATITKKDKVKKIANNTKKPSTKTPEEKVTTNKTKIKKLEENKPNLKVEKPKAVKENKTVDKPIVNKPETLKVDKATVAKEKLSTKKPNTAEPILPKIPLKPIDDNLAKNPQNSEEIPGFPNGLQLTHEGEIPVLHIDENNFISTDNSIDRVQNKNLLKLIDHMNITSSALDCDLGKFKNSSSENATGVQENSNNTEEGHSADSLTFTNCLNKITSTPNSVQLKVVLNEVIEKKTSVSSTFLTDGLPNSTLSNSSTRENNNLTNSLVKKRRRCIISFKD